MSFHLSEPLIVGFLVLIYGIVMFAISLSSSNWEMNRNSRYVIAFSSIFITVDLMVKLVLLIADVLI